MESKRASIINKKILTYKPLILTPFGDNDSRRSSSESTRVRRKKSSLNYTTLGTLYNDIDKTKRFIIKEIKTTRSNRAKLEKIQLHNRFLSKQSQLIILNNKFRLKDNEIHHQHKTKNSTLFSTPFKDSKILLTEDPRRESTKKFTKMTNFTHFTEQNESKETDNKRITIKDKKESEASSAFSDDSSKTFSSMIINQGPSRLKTFLIIDKPNWHEKRQLEYIKYSKESMRSQEVQQKAIKDQILLLSDNVQIFKVRYLSNKEILTLFNSLDRKVKIKLNKLLEETIGLMITTAYLLLMDFGDNIDKFITNPMWKVSKEDNKIITDEAVEFCVNAKIFNDASNFLKSCNQVYAIISSKESEFVFSIKDFAKIIQYIERSRLNVSELLFSIQNLFKNYKKDKEIVQEYQREMERIKRYNGRKTYYHQRTKSNFEGGIDYTRYKGPIVLQSNEEQDKKNRIQRCLEDSGITERKHLKTRKFDINSKLIDKLMKYATEGFRAMICCERIVRRFKAREEFEEENKYINDGDI